MRPDLSKSLLSPSPQHLIFAILTGALMASSGFAGTVAKVVSPKKVVIVTGASGDGAEKGGRYCFFAGKKRVACGKVRKVSGDKAFVKVGKKISAIKPKMRAQFNGSSGGKGSASNDVIELRGGWVYVITAPTTFQTIQFDPTVTADQNLSGDSAWVSAGDAGGSAFSGIGEVTFPVSDYKLGLGIRYRKRSFLSDANYNENGALHLEVLGEDSGVAFYSNFYFPRIDMGSVALEFGTGLDFESSNLSVTITQKADDGSGDNLAYEGTSSLTTVSLGLHANLWFPISDILSGYLGFQALVPVSGTASGFSGDEITDVQIVNATTNPSPLADLNTALDHKKSSVGLLVTLGGALSF